MTNVLLSAALSYAARGWPVHPCRGKQPLTSHWRDEASTDPDQLRVWWTRWPNANIAIVCGRASGLYIIDEDEDGASVHLDLPPTLTVYSGRGRHYYYAIPPGDEPWPNTAKKALGAGVDSRGDGGYVCAPPSVHSSGKIYAWGDESEAIAPLPENVRELLRKPVVRDMPIQQVPRPRIDAGSDAVIRARAYMRTVDQAISGSGGHNVTMRVASMLVNGWDLNRDDADVLLFDWNRGNQPPWSEKELAHKLDDAIKLGPPSGKVRGWLLEKRVGETGGFEDHGSGCDIGAGGLQSEKELTPFERARLDLMAAGFGVNGVKDVDLGGTERVGFTPASGLFDEDFGETPWMVRGLLTERSLCTVGGEPKTTKTWAALELAMGVATGTPSFGSYAAMKPPAGVALFLAEDSRRSVRNRLRALASSRGMDPREATANVHAKYLAAIDLRSLDQLAWLVVDVRAIAGGVSLVVLDPLRDCHGAEENSSSEMAVVTHAMRALRVVCGCSVLFVHHMGKTSEGGGAKANGKRGGQMMRGSSALHGSVDCGLYLTGLKTDKQSWWTNKAEVEIKGVRSAGEFMLTWKVEDVNDEAVAGQWTVDNDAQAAKAAAAAREEEEVVGKVVNALRENRSANMGASVPMAEAFLRTMVGVGSAKLRSAVDNAIKRGLVSKGPKGLTDLTDADSVKESQG